MIARREIGAAALAVALMLAGSAKTQEPATEADRQAEIPTWTKSYLKNLAYAEKQLADIAEDFSEDLYNTYRPTGDEDSRTAAEILLHVAFTNASYGFSLSTEAKKQAYAEAHGGAPIAINFRFVSKADTVAQVKEAFAALRQAISETPNPEDNILWVYALVHSSEHYGNLVTYYRVNGLVPPASRQ